MLGMPMIADKVIRENPTLSKKKGEMNIKSSLSKLLLFGSLISAIFSFVLGTKHALLSAGLLLANAILLQSLKEKKC